MMSEPPENLYNGSTVLKAGMRAFQKALPRLNSMVEHPYGFSLA